MNDNTQRAGRAENTAALILSQLAHIHHFGPHAAVDRLTGPTTQEET